MRLVVFVDDNLGISFNSKRQSKDRIAIDKLLEHIGDSEILLTEYSSKLFESHEVAKVIIENLEYLPCDGTVIIEDLAEDLERSIDGMMQHLDKLILIRWNRKYPFTTKLPKILQEIIKKNPEHTEEFKGSSHDKITLEVYNIE